MDMENFEMISICRTRWKNGMPFILRDVTIEILARIKWAFNALLKSLGSFMRFFKYSLLSKNLIHIHIQKNLKDQCSGYCVFFIICYLRFHRLQDHNQRRPASSKWSIRGMGWTNFKSLPILRQSWSREYPFTTEKCHKFTRLSILTTDETVMVYADKARDWSSIFDLLRNNDTDAIPLWGRTLANY